MPDPTRPIARFFPSQFGAGMIPACRGAYVRHDDYAEAIARAERAEADRDALLPWARLGAAAMDGWPDYGDIDGFQLQEIATEVGVLSEVPGGFDPEKHTGDSWGAEPGDRWLVMRDVPPALVRLAEGGK